MTVTTMWASAPHGVPALIGTKLVEVPIKPTGERITTQVAKWTEEDPYSSSYLVYFIVASAVGTGGLYPAGESLSSLHCGIIKTLDTRTVTLDNFQLCLLEASGIRKGHSSRPVFASSDILINTLPNHVLTSFMKLCRKYDSDLSASHDGIPCVTDAYEYKEDNDLEYGNEANVSSTENNSGLGRETKPPVSGIYLFAENVAHRTLRAYIFYLTTGNISFISRTSEAAKDTLMPSCSPRSMYRLANNSSRALYALQVGMNTLEKLALDAIEADLTESNIIEHLFSKFSSMYPAVQKVEMQFLRSHRTRAVTRQVQQMVPKACTPEHSHCVVGLLAEPPAQRARYDYNEASF